MEGIIVTCFNCIIEAFALELTILVIVDINLVCDFDTYFNAHFVHATVLVKYSSCIFLKLQQKTHVKLPKP